MANDEQLSILKQGVKIGISYQLRCWLLLETILLRQPGAAVTRAFRICNRSDDHLPG